MKHVWNKMRHEDRGLTLIELLITISVLAIIAAIALPLVNNVISASNSKALQQTIVDAQTFIDKYSQSGVVGYDGLQTLSGYIDLDGDDVIEVSEKVDSLTFDDKYELTATGTSSVGGRYSNGGVVEVTIVSTDLSSGSEPIIAAGRVIGIGDNAWGQITIPLNVGSDNEVIAIAAGDNHSLALKSDGTVVGWGDNDDGQITIPAGLTGVTAISAGGYHSLALKNDGTVVAWGNNDDGQINVPAGLTNVIAIAGGGWHSLALKSDGTVVGFGWNDSGQVTSPAGLTGVTAIAAGWRHSLAVKNDGTVVAWGNNGDGQTTIPAGLAGVTAIAAGAYHSLALKSDGTVVGWGRNTYGQRTIPAGLTGVTAIGGGWDHSAALKNDGTVVAWGRNQHGQKDVTYLSSIIAISVSDDQMLAITTAPLG